MYRGMAMDFEGRIEMADRDDVLNNLSWYMIAKSSSDDDQLWLPLKYHLVDTALVAERLLKKWVPSAFFDEIGINRNDAGKIVRFLSLTHDLGKATPVFQSMISAKIPDIAEQQLLNGLTLKKTYSDENKTKHAHAGAMILRKYGVNESISAVIGSHHGKTEKNGIDNCEIDLYASNYGKGEEYWEKIQKLFLDEAIEKAGYANIDDLPVLSDYAQMLISGILIMADWLSSNTYYFPLLSVDFHGNEYDQTRIDTAWERIALPDPYLISDHWKYGDFFYDRFGFNRNSIQDGVIKIAESMKAPGLIILEAPMGIGKTETALAAAEVFMNRFKLGGAAVFLPTQATTNAMFDRVMKWIVKQPDCSEVTIQLAHSNSELNESYTDIKYHNNEDEDHNIDKLTVQSFFCRNKTKLLSEIVIGTIDQFLMASLKRKHVMLRHLGLSGKVIIIDECHAYDAYMNIYLDRTLNWLGAYNIPIILLSATLPGKRRMELMQAYSGSREIREDIIRNTAYPVLSYVQNKGTDNQQLYNQVALEYRGKNKFFNLIKCSSTEEMIAEIVAATEAGACVGIILNTVWRVQEFYHELRNKLDDIDIMIDHSQYIMTDRIKTEDKIIKRLGKNSTCEQRRRLIVIGTQVLEQSLDIDFDLMITDFCPIDLLFQRLGREHRHDRKRPDGYSEARCLILNADADNLESGAKAIYGEYILRRTLDLLPEKVELPADISRLVQLVYDETAGKEKYHEEYEQFEKIIKDKQRNAKTFCIAAPSKSRRVKSIVGLTDSPDIISEIQAEASVRDGDMPLEVLMLKLTGNEYVEIMAGDDKGIKINRNKMPSNEEALIIAKQRIKLPSKLSKSYLITKVIEAIEQADMKIIPEWLNHPLLSGELFVIADNNNNIKIDGFELHYDEITGLEIKNE